MARQTGRTGQDRSQLQAQAQAQAAAIIAQGRQVEAEILEREIPQAPAALEREEPMNRYIHPISLPGEGRRERGLIQVEVSLERVLESIACQNQLLVDLLGAVNALTAAMLSDRSQP